MRGRAGPGRLVPRHAERCLGRRVGRPSTSSGLVCSGCPVIHECLWYALEAPERFGVWGGASEADRARLRRGLTTSGSSTGWQPAPTSTGSTGSGMRRERPPRLRADLRRRQWHGRPRRRVRRGLHPPARAHRHRPPHRRDHVGADPVRLHPRGRVRAMRNQSPPAADAPMPRRLAPHRRRHRRERALRRPQRLGPGRTGRRGAGRRPGHRRRARRRTGRGWRSSGSLDPAAGRRPGPAHRPDGRPHHRPRVHRSDHRGRCSGRRCSSP